MMRLLRFLTAGESHGPKLTAILEGVPAGFAIDARLINQDLERRQQGFGRGGRMKIEKDQAIISAGVTQNTTTGGPIAIDIANLDYAKWAQKDIQPLTIPRPGHADLVGAIKYNHPDLRLSLERASARETAARVAVGAIAKQILHQFGIEVHAYVTQIGQLSADTNGQYDKKSLAAYARTAKGNEFALPIKGLEDAVREEISRAMKAKDTLGGILEIAAIGVPAGLGSYVHWDRKLDARLGAALLSIQAMKGVEFAHAFEQSKLRGTKVHDEIFAKKTGVLYRKTNRAGGLEGGVTTGEPIVARVAMKPISTTLKPLKSVDLVTGKAKDTVYERSDFCAVPRACPILEAMWALVLLDALMERLGADDREHMLKAYAHVRQSRLQDLHLHNQTWRFGYGD